MYHNIADDANDKNKWLEHIKGEITKNKNTLETIKKSLLEICNNPEIESINIFPKFKNKVKNVFDGNFSNTATEEEKTGIISRLDNISKYIQATFDEALKIIKPIAKAYEAGIASYEKLNVPVPGSFGLLTQQRQPSEPSGKVGGEYNQKGGKSENLSKANEEIDAFDGNYKKVINVVDQIDQVFRKAANPLLAASMSSSPGMFGNILSKYRQDAFIQGSIIAAEKMEESLKANNLLPGDVLKITTFDRGLFALVSLFLRSISLYIVESLIQNNKITNIQYSLFAFIIIYSGLFVLSVLYVNLDTYKLRILLNYMNLNINSSQICMHLILLYIITYGIYLVITNLKFPIKGITATSGMSEEDKAYLKYQLEIITVIVWIFVLSLVACL